jgi:hypothetical protein
MRRPQGFFSVAIDTRSVHLAVSIDNFRWTRSADNQVSAVNDQIWRGRAQIGDHGVERSQIRVNVR